MSPTSMSRSRRSFSTEFKDELCREVIDSAKPISEVAKAYGVGDDSLRRWLAKYRDTHGGGADSELTLTERARLTQLERENRELRAEAAFLKKAALNSTCQRNSLFRHKLRGCSEPEALPWPVVELGCDGIEVFLAQIAEIHSLRKVLA